jgi:hypothetical protein
MWNKLRQRPGNTVNVTRNISPYPAKQKYMKYPLKISSPILHQPG